MCGRIPQHRTKATYVKEIGWPDTVLNDGVEERPPNWNISPGTNPWLMHRFVDNRAQINSVNWGYRPAWATEKNIPIAIDARIEKLLTGGYFRVVFKSGRAIIPADGWYEWTGVADNKQPWYIHLQSESPMFMAAVTDYRSNIELPGYSGFAIVTTAAEGGLMDVHNRRPVVFTAADALLWMDNPVSTTEAEQLARKMVLPAEAFHWYKVSKDVNKTVMHDAHLIQPIIEPQIIIWSSPLPNN